MELPVLLASLGGVLINAARGMIVQVLIALGVSVVTYQGMDSAITWAKTQAVQNIQGLPPLLSPQSGTCSAKVARNKPGTHFFCRASSRVRRAPTVMTVDRSSPNRMERAAKC